MAHSRAGETRGSPTGLDDENSLLNFDRSYMKCPKIVFPVTGNIYFILMFELCIKAYLAFGLKIPSHFVKGQYTCKCCKKNCHYLFSVDCRTSYNFLSPCHQDAIKKGVSDADADARSFARKLVIFFLFRLVPSEHTVL